MARAAVPEPLIAALRERVRSSARVEAQGDYYQLAFRCMNTLCRVSFRAAQLAAARDLHQRILEWMADFEARYSRFIEESLVGQINQAAGRDWIEIDTEAEALFALCEELAFFTHHTFDPASLPLMRLWNWKASPPRVPDAAALSDALEKSGWRKVLRRPGVIRLPVAGMGIDLGGIGKEFAVDQVLHFARTAGLLDVLVDFGQDVRVYGQAPGRGAWHVGLEDPRQPGQCWAGVAVTNHAVATSGDYFQHFTVNGQRYGHILDPRTGCPVNNGCLSVSVIAPSCTLAGVLATCAFVLGPREGLDLVARCPGAEACVTTQTGRCQTRDFMAYVLN